MKSRRTLFIVVGILAVIGLWAAFRPELLFVKKPVDEPLPGATSQLIRPVEKTSLAAVTFTGAGATTAL